MGWIFTILAWVLPTKTVDGAIAVVQKAIDKLAAAEKVQAEMALKSREQGYALLDKAEVATEQAARAARIRTNLSTLVN